MAKKIYFGATTQVTTPGSITTYSITSSNISTYFTVTNSSYYFAGSGSTFTSNNAGVASSTAKTTLVAKKSGTISFDYSYSSESTYDKFTLIVGTTTVENAVSGATTSKSYSGTINVGDIIEFQYSKDSSVNKNDDQCTFSNMKIQVQGSSTTTTKQNIARKVSKCYFGVGGVARKVKKGYIGVGGVARPFIGGDTVSYYGTITNLSSARSGLGGASIGGYALFAGGRPGSAVSTVDTYNNTLVKGTAASLPEIAVYLSAGTVGDYAVFTTENYLVAYNKNLTRSTYTQLSGSRYYLGVANTNGYLLFAGGRDDGGNKYNIVEAYNNTLTKTTADNLESEKMGLSGASVGGYAIFAGGQNSSKVMTAKAEYYTSSLTKTSLSDLSTGRYFLTGGSTGANAIFAGGWNENPLSNVDSYSSSLVHSKITNLPEPKSESVSVSIGGNCIFSGGNNPLKSNRFCSSTHVFSSTLSLSTLTSLSVGRYEFAGASVGDYVLFAGGSGYSTSNIDVVDAYVLT